MKKIYIVIVLLALSAGAFSQTADSLLRRQMELERDFNPSLPDADKINSLPALREPTVQKANTNYSNRAGRITPPLEIALARPGTIMTEIPFNLKRGYLSFLAGNYANLDGAFGYRLVENEKNDLTFTFLHNSTKGDIKYTQDEGPKKNQASAMDNEGRLGFRHRAEALTFDIDLSYLHSLFNYYGNRFAHTPLYEDDDQRLGVLSAKIGIKSKESMQLNYRGYLTFRNFSTDFGETLSQKGIKGNEVNAMVGFDKPFGEAGNKMGIDGTINNTFYGGDLFDYLLLNASPYITFGNQTTYARLGADILFQNFDGSRARVAPNVKIEWGVAGHTSLYANIHGGYSNNTYLEMIRESRYINPFGNVKPSFSVVSVDAGVKIGELSGFRFDIFGGFRKTDDEHFLILNGQDIDSEGVPGPFRESLKPLYGNLSHTHIGGMIQSNIWAPLDISLRLKKNFYDMDPINIDGVVIDKPEAYNKPGFEVDIRAAYSLTDQIKLTANYYYADERWSYFSGENLKMDPINDLNAGAVYQINDAFSINLRVNNLLSQKYDIWYGYPAQRLNASGGFSFRF